MKMYQIVIDFTAILAVTYCYPTIKSGMQMLVYESCGLLHYVTGVWSGLWPQGGGVGGRRGRI